MKSVSVESSPPSEAFSQVQASVTLSICGKSRSDAESLPAGLAPQEQRDEAVDGREFSVEARSQVQAPAGRAPEGQISSVKMSGNDEMTYGMSSEVQRPCFRGRLCHKSTPKQISVHKSILLEPLSLFISSRSRKECLPNVLTTDTFIFAFSTAGSCDHFDEIMCVQLRYDGSWGLKTCVELIVEDRCKSGRSRSFYRAVKLLLQPRLQPRNIKCFELHAR